jgi:hypothetical protein
VLGSHKPSIEKSKSRSLERVRKSQKKVIKHTMNMTKAADASIHAVSPLSIEGVGEGGSVVLHKREVEFSTGVQRREDCPLQVEKSTEARRRAWEAMRVVYGSKREV